MGNDTPATPAGTPVLAPERNVGKNTKPQGRQGKPRKPMEKARPATQAVKMPLHMSGGLAPPTHKAANDASKNKPVTNESLIAESVFAVDSGFTPKQREIEFSPSTSGWTQTVDDAFVELRNDSKVQVAKELPIEAFRYYASAMFWLRAISLKLWQGQELTQSEVEIQRVFEGKTFVLPDPIHLGLKAVGKVTTKNGEVLAPTFPSLPDQIVADTPGVLAAVSTANHNTYEDYPVLGVAYQGCYERAQTTNQSTYVSAVAPANTTANRNLQGFDTLKPTRTDGLSTLYSMGFEIGIRPRTISQTGFNYNALKVVSNLLARTDTFKTVEVDIFTIPVTGSLGQIIETIPDPTLVEDLTRASDCEVNCSMLCYGHNDTDRHLTRGVRSQRLQGDVRNQTVAIMELRDMDGDYTSPRRLCRKS